MKFRMIVEGVGEPLVIDECAESALPREGDAITLRGADSGQMSESTFVVDRIGHGPMLPTVFVRPA